MDHQWRPRPIQGNICPICSISHFPFCPPHPSLDQYPRFSLENNRLFQRPVLDPLIDNRAHPFVGYPNDGYGDPPFWNRNPNLERDAYVQFPFQPQIGGVHRDGFGSTVYDYGKNDFLSGGDRNSKRMRFDETDSGSFSNDYHLNPTRFMSEDERRLKLIRDHGGASSGVPHGGTVSGLGISTGFNGEIKGYSHENSTSERNFGNSEVVDRGKFDDFRGCRGEIQMNNIHDAGFGSVEREGSSFREEHGSTFGQQYMQINRNGFQSNVDHSVFRNEGDGVHSQNEGLKQSQYFQNEHPPHPSLPTYGHNGLPTRVSDNVGQSHSSQHGPYPILEVQNENYNGHNLQHLQLKNSVSVKEPPNSHIPNWQATSGLSVPYHEKRNSLAGDGASNNLPGQSYTFEHPVKLKQDFQSHVQLSDVRQSFEVRFPSQEGNQGTVLHQNSPVGAQYGSHRQGGYLPIHTGSNIVSEGLSQMQASRSFHVQPPLPASPPPPLPVDPPGRTSSKSKTSSSAPMTSSPLFPVPASSLAMAPSSYPPVPGANSLSQPYFHNKSHLHASTGFATEEPQDIRGTSSKQYLAEGQPYLMKHPSSEKPNSIDASHLFKQPHRVGRPDHVVIILRGLPGSGKSYLAKMLRDLEVESGSDAPRIYSMDDYFMTEVEKVEESESMKSFSARGKKPIVKKVMEYCYEPEMEEAYRASMLKAFKKTLEEGVFTFIIVDDRNLRVADFAQFWATAKRSGYEVYLLEASYKDPAGCAARNVHGFTQDDIQRMAGQWEEAPSMYLQLDIKSLFQGDDLKESGIQEVDMDTEDGDCDGGLSGSQEEKSEKVAAPHVEDYAPDGSSKDGKRWDAEGDHPAEVKELGSSKWSNDLDEDDNKKSRGPKENLNALSGLIQAYSKGGKSVHWGDQVCILLHQVIIL
ncbi:hypothetical protein PVL29_022372 [Vitis rotundifolia]|uniref:YLP motif-containing protein 1 n=1 Tax=Vitis rotundifolia TaxID=103349 RepID=A0AA38YVM4_VITRO|nr:hypothetical protein PVL29_022372 [Vitis rotundifolia]